MRRLSSYLVALSLVFSASFFAPAAQAVTPEEWAGRLATIEDQSLRTTLQNSIAAGLIADRAEFDTAVARAEARRPAFNPIARGSTATGGLGETISTLAAPIAKLDRDAVPVKKVEGFRSADKLFQPYTGKIPASYETAYALALKFNPKSGTNDAGRLDAEIDAYLASIADDPVIKHALSSTGSTMSDLKRNWFGEGLGFEHVIAGEVKGSEVSGYHWWYRFYRDEQTGSAQYLSTLANANDEHAYTGQFTWDPDGNGPLPRAKKKKGGFSIGHSVQAILALGHIAIESARKTGKVPGAFTFFADINGQSFNWQCYAVNGTIRSLYPMGSKSGNSPEVMAAEYYQLEEGAAEALNPEGNITIH